jgi:hypothetical protein
MGSTVRDLRYALRQLRRAPVFSVVVVLMLALGIGANTAVFSVMNAVLMQLLPVANPHSLYYVRMANGEAQPPGAGNTGDSNTSFSEAAFEALRQRTDVFDDLIGYVPLSFNGSVAVRHGELPESAEGEEVSGNFFTGLTVRMERGRGFTRQDEAAHAAVVVLSYDYWTRSFARDPQILGQTIYIKGIPFSVVGIAARGFKGIEPATASDFWIPLQSRPELNAWGTPAAFDTLYGSPKWWCFRMMARLRQGSRRPWPSRLSLAHLQPSSSRPSATSTPGNGSRCSTSSPRAASMATTSNTATPSPFSWDWSPSCCSSPARTLP